MGKYLIVVIPSEQSYIVDISTSGGDKGTIVRHKLYNAENLRQDMKDYLNVSDEGFLNVLKIMSETGVYATEASLSDVCTVRLGWS